MSLASISTVAVSLLVLGMFLLIFLNTNNLAQYLESQVQVSVYMQDNASAEELKAVEAKLKKMTLLKQGMMQDLLTGKVRLV